MRSLFTSIILAAALTGCGSSTPTDLTATNAAIDKVATSIDANTAAIKAANAPNPAPAVIDPESCTLPTGMAKTKVDDKGRVVSTSDALMKGEIAVFGCDIGTSPNDWRAWLVKGVKAGDEGNNQGELLVDSHGNALTFNHLRGITSKTKWVTPKGTHFQVECRDISGDGTGCDKIKVEKPETVIMVNGHKVTISGS